MTAKEARNAYHRAWRAAHPEQVKAARERYWTKKAAKMTRQEAENGKTSADAQHH